MEQAVIILALAAAGLFGLALALAPYGLRDLDPLAGACIAIPTATVALWMIVPFLTGFAGRDLRAVAIFAGVGVLFPALVTLLTFLANQKLGPGTAAALGNLAPLFAIVFALVFLGEVPRAVQLVGLVIVAIGVTLLALGRGGPSGAAGLVLLLPLAAAAIRGLVQPVAKVGLALWPDPFAAILIGYSISTLVVLAAGWRAGVLPALPLRPGGWWFAAVGLCNAGAVLALYAALARGPVGLVAPLVGTYPLVTVLLAFILPPRRPLGGARLVGAIVTVIGIVVLVGG